jgi:hypothetical protein
MDFNQPPVDVGDDVSDGHRPRIVGHTPSIQIALLAAGGRIGAVAACWTQTGVAKQAHGQ